MSLIADLISRATPEQAARSPYGYVPTEWICILFVVLFGVSTALHVSQSLWYRKWWLLLTAVLSGLLEILGWVARLWSSLNPPNPKPFQMQIACTIIGPTPLLAANFVILGEMIKMMGALYSRLPPKWYTIIFCSCDVISLVVQALGGGRAAAAVNTGGNPEIGANIMLGGIAFQMFVITLYAICAFEFFFRYFHDKPIKSNSQTAFRGAFTGRLQIMSAALLLSTTCLWIRAVYRVIELADGWGGRILETQVYFNVLDGAMVVLAIFTVNLFHPGIFLKPSRKTLEKKELA